MPPSRPNIRLHRDTRAALTDTLPVGAGMFPLGIAFGVLVTQARLAWYWAPAMSAPLFAGSLEFLLLTLMTAGARLATIALTTLLVNSAPRLLLLDLPAAPRTRATRPDLRPLRADRRGLRADHDA